MDEEGSNELAFGKDREDFRVFRKRLADVSQMPLPIPPHPVPRFRELLRGRDVANRDERPVVRHFDYRDGAVSEFGSYFVRLFRHAAGKGESGFRRPDDPGIVRMEYRDGSGIAGVRDRMDSRIDGRFAISRVLDLPFFDIRAYADEIGFGEFRFVDTPGGYRQSVLPAERDVSVPVGEEVHDFGKFEHVFFRIFQYWRLDFLVRFRREPIHAAEAFFDELPH